MIQATGKMLASKFFKAVATETGGTPEAENGEAQETVTDGTQETQTDRTQETG